MNLQQIERATIDPYRAEPANEFRRFSTSSFAFSRFHLNCERGTRPERHVSTIRGS